MGEGGKDWVCYRRVSRYLILLWFDLFEDFVLVFGINWRILGRLSLVVPSVFVYGR